MKHLSSTQVSTLLVVGLCIVASPDIARGQGGCGSVCVPLESLDPERAQLIPGQFRVAVTSDYADFNRFVEGGSTVTNPGGNQAIIHETAVFLHYGAWTPTRAWSHARSRPSAAVSQAWMAGIALALLAAAMHWPATWPT